MHLNKELAELTGAILGDGCLSKYWSKSENRYRYEIAFTSNLDEKEYYQKFIIPTFSKNFGMTGRLIQRKGEQATRFHMKSRKVFSFFRQLGLPVGKKPENMKIPDRILADKELALACVKGIWDTDGCIYQRYKKQYSYHPKHYSHHLVLQLKMNANLLLSQIKIILAAEGIESNSIRRERKAAVLRITNQKSIHLFLSKVGFRNNHHLRRLDLFRQLI
jgi:intein/homing endonuclease